jgi:hypothetical protein
VQPFYRRTGGGAARHGTTETGAAGTRSRRHRCIVARLSEIDGRVARASWQGRDTRHGKSLAAGPIGGWSRPVEGRALAWLIGSGMPCCMAVLLCRLEQSRGGERREREGEGEKREGGREKRARIQIKFSPNFEQKLEKL